MVNRCIALDCTLETLPLQEYRAQSLLFAEDVYPAIDLLTCVENRNVFGGRAPKQVLGQIERAEAKLNP